LPERRSGSNDTPPRSGTATPLLTVVNYNISTNPYDTDSATASGIF